MAVELPPLFMFRLPHTSHGGFPQPIFFSFTSEEEEDREEERFTRWQSALRLSVGTWASGFVKGLGRGFARVPGPGAQLSRRSGSHRAAGAVCRVHKQVAGCTGVPVLCVFLDHVFVGESSN